MIMTSGSASDVLISTYWNVNVERYVAYEIEPNVLISTYWNVNLGIAPANAL